MKKIISISALSLMLLSSCKKDSQPEPFVISQKTLNGKYKLTGAIVKNPNGGDIDIFNNPDPTMNVFQPCHKDDIHELAADLKYVVTDAGTVCTPTSASQSSWKFISPTQMELDGDAVAIKSFDGKKLVVGSTVAGFPTEVSFTRQ
jgi:hypothetical protein